jgi:hypothetical protein
LQDHRRVLSSLTPADQQSINMYTYATLTKVRVHVCMYVHTVAIFILEILLHYIQSQFSTVRSDGSYFVESEAFWKPALDQEQLYHQLCANKYREISRYNIK